MILFSFAILLSYALLILSFYLGGLRVRPKKESPQNSLSVVIPFRNEVNRIEPLIASLNRADYEGLSVQLIFVDDHSTDATIEFIEEHLKASYELIVSSSEGKKNALTEGIAMAAHSYVLTLDADIYFEVDYFKQVIHQIKDQDCIILPVRSFANKNNVLQHLDVLEFKSLQTATFGSIGLGQPFLSNGANFLFKKVAFDAVQGYSGNLEISSGDDQYLLDKFKKSGMKISGIVDSRVMVTTLAESSLIEFFRQRIRWSSKSFAIRNFWTFLNSGLIFTINVAVIIWLMLLPFSKLAVDFVGFLMLKLILDYALILNKRSAYELGKSVYYIPLLSIIYPFYLLFLIPAGLIMRPKWKDRTIKK